MKHSRHLAVIAALLALSAAAPSHADGPTREEIVRHLHRTTLVSPGSLNLVVDGGVVTVNGNARDSGEVARLKRAIASYPGVTDLRFLATD